MSNSETLSHHGVPGMKWGIRRYQNKDGSLTPAGRRKAQQLKSEFKSLTGKKLKGKIPSEDPSKKKLMDLSDTQLKDRLKRLENLKKANDLEEELMASKGHKVMKSIGKDVLAPAAIQAGKRVMESIFYDAMAKATGIDKKDVKNGFKEVKKEAQKEKSKVENSKEYKDFKEDVNIFVFNNSKSYDRYAKKGKEYVPEADIREENTNTTALTRYNPNNRKKGKSFFNNIFD